MYCIIKFCCFCLTEREQLINLSKRNYRNITIANKLMFCINNDLDMFEIPTFICVKCCNKLEEVYKFKTMSLKNWNFFQGYVRKLENVNPKCETIFNDIKILISDFKLKEFLVKSGLKCEGEDKDKRASEEACNGGALEEACNGGALEEACNGGIVKQETELLIDAIEDFELDEVNVNTITIKDEIVNINENQDQAATISDGHLYYCSTCGKSFARLTKLKFHALTHIKQDGRCENSNKDSYVPNHKCSKCDKNFCSKRSLQRHIISKHRNENPMVKHHKETANLFCYTCKECFSTDLDMKTHVLIHSDKKPFTCSQCGRGFTQKWNYNRHLLTHKYQNQNRYSCSVCGNHFFTKRSLKRHALIHSRKRLHSCTICKKTYFRERDLNGHITKYHNKARINNLEEIQNFEMNLPDYFEKHLPINILKSEPSFEFVDIQPEELELIPVKEQENQKYNYQEDFINDESSLDNIPEAGCNNILLEKSNYNKIKLLITEHSDLNINNFGNDEIEKNCMDLDEEKENLTYANIGSELSQHSLGHDKSSSEIPNTSQEITSLKLPSTQLLVKNEENLKMNNTENRKKSPNIYKLKSPEHIVSEESSDNTNEDSLVLKNKRIKKNLVDDKHILSSETSCKKPNGGNCLDPKKKGNTVTKACKVNNNENYLLIKEEQGDMFICFKCGNQFKSKSVLRSHQTTHMETKPFSCYNCELKFKSKFHLKRHMPTHSTILAFSCSLCNKRFKSKRNLAQHVQFHSNKRSHLCYTCGRSFQKRSVLNRHMMTHTNLRPHVCITCGKGFAIKQGLTQHMFSHMKTRPVSVCTMCSKAFKDKNTLIKHMSTHEEERPHSCYLCDKAFFKESALRIHITKLHPGEHKLGQMPQKLDEIIDSIKEEN